MISNREVICDRTEPWHIGDPRVLLVLLLAVKTVKPVLSHPPVVYKSRNCLSIREFVCETNSLRYLTFVR